MLSKGGAPNIDPHTDVPTERVEKPATPSTQEVQSPPASDESTPPETDEGQFYKQNSDDGSTFFEAPALHDPNDRTVYKNTMAPVKTAVYKQATSYRSVSAGKITAEQARQDAIGWSSASK